MLEVRMKGELWSQDKLCQQDAVISGEYCAYFDDSAGFAAWALLRSISDKAVGYEVRHARLEVRRAEALMLGEHDAAPYDYSEFYRIVDHLSDDLGENWVVSDPTKDQAHKLAAKLNAALKEWACEEGVSIEAHRAVGEPLLVVDLTKDAETKWRLSDEDRAKLDALT